MSQATVVSSRAQCETAASAAAIFVLSTPWSNSINASWYGCCHFGYFICSFSMEPPSLSEGTFARQRIFGCAKVGKSRVYRFGPWRPVSCTRCRCPNGRGVAVGCVSTSRPYSHASEKASQTGEGGEDRLSVIGQPESMMVYQVIKGSVRVPSNRHVSREEL